MSEDKKLRARYRTTNWREYNAGLKARGSLAVWLDKDKRQVFEFHVRVALLNRFNQLGRPQTVAAA